MEDLANGDARPQSPSTVAAGAGTKFEALLQILRLDHQQRHQPARRMAIGYRLSEAQAFQTQIAALGSCNPGNNMGWWSATKLRQVVGLTVHRLWVGSWVIQTMRTEVRRCF